MSTELPLLIRTRLVLNPSIMSMMAKGSSCGCFTLLVSSSENRMSILVFLLCFKGGALWTLFTYLCCDFLRDLKDPPVDDPPMIVFISPIVLCGRLCEFSSSLGLGSGFSLRSTLDRLDSPFFTNFYNFPLWISSSICSFRSLQFSM